MCVFHVLIDAVEIVDGPGLRGRCGEQVFAKRHVGLAVAQIIENGGHDVGLLGYSVYHAYTHLAAGVEENDGGGKAAQCRLILSMVAHIGMVAGEHEDGVLIPRLTAGRLEEMLQGHVGIAYDFVDGQLLFGEAVAPGLGHLEGMMAGEREERRHEGLLHLRHFLAEVLQERLVADAPVAVEVGLGCSRHVALEIFTSVVLTEFRGVGES